MSKQKSLVLIDTDKIHDYVFSTNKLREIRGASSILDMLNSQSTFDLLQNISTDGNYECDYSRLNDKTIKKDNVDWEVVFLGGGSGKILFADRKEAEKFCKLINEEYTKATDNEASITAVIVDEKEGEDFKHLVYRGEKELRKKKDSKSIKVQPFTSSYFKTCESTGNHPAEEIGDDRSRISKATKLKRTASKGSQLYFAQFRDWLVTQEDGVKSNWKKVLQTDFSDENQIKKLFLKDLNSIGSLSSNYVGFIYADGNRMGQYLAKCENPDDYRCFSDKIRKGAKNAIFHSLSHLKCENIMPFEIMILGGDDVMVVVPANKAIEIAIDFCDSFKSQTKVSICAGIVITHSSYPIHRMIDHAEQLLKSAKSLSNEKYQKNKNDEVNAIDFMIIKGALLKELNEIREKDLLYNSLSLYQRPYTTEQLKSLIHWIKKFKESDFPHNKLRTMYESLFRGKNQAILDYLFIISRLQKRSSQRDVVMNFRNQWKGGTDNLPWWRESVGSIEYNTPFADMIELYDFVE